MSHLDKSNRDFNCCSSSTKHYWHKWRWDQREWAPAESVIQADLQGEQGVGSDRCWSVFRDWAHRFCIKAQPFLLSCLSQKPVCAHARSPRDFAALSKQLAFSPRPRFEVGDARLVGAGLWGQPTEPCRTGTTMRSHFEVSLGRARQGVPLFRGGDCGQASCCRPQFIRYGESVLSDWGWGFGAGRELRAVISAPGAVPFVCCSDERRSHMVTWRGFSWYFTRHVLRFYHDLCIYFVACLVQYSEWEVPSDPAT